MIFKKAVIVGGVVPSRDLARFKRTYGIVDNAAQKFQTKIINGLVQNNIASIDVLSIPFIYTNQRKIWIRSETTSELGIRYWIIPFINLPFIRNISRELFLKRQVKRYLKENDYANTIFILYSLSSPIISAAKAIKKVLPHGSKIILIVPDLPQFMRDSATMSKLILLLKWFDIRRMSSFFTYIDRFVLIAESMQEVLKIDKNSCITIEGIHEVDEPRAEINLEIDELLKHATVTYTGSLEHRYGVNDLVDSFEYIKNNNLRLCICGSGALEGYIRRKAELDNRIVILGNLGFDMVRRIQEESTILVNPRKPNSLYTRYSFPSKLLEYIATGNTVLCYKLEGIPDEYNDYLTYIMGDQPQDIANSIIESLFKISVSGKVRNMDARNFIMSKKNPKIQIERLLKDFD